MSGLQNNINQEVLSSSSKIFCTSCFYWFLISIRLVDGSFRISSERSCSRNFIVTACFFQVRCWWATYCQFGDWSVVTSAAPCYHVAYLLSLSGQQRLYNYFPHLLGLVWFSIVINIKTLKWLDWYLILRA